MNDSYLNEENDRKPVSSEQWVKREVYDELHERYKLVIKELNELKEANSYLNEDNIEIYEENDKLHTQNKVLMYTKELLVTQLESLKHESAKFSAYITQLIE